MAKSTRKSESGGSGDTGGAQPAPRKKATPKKAAARKSAPPTGGAPMIDTSFAAEAAAKMLAAGFNRPAAAGTNAQKPQESAMFKQLKAGLNKTHSTAISNILDKSHGPEPAKSHPSMKQIGQNQTFGADVTRSGVPRRTPG
jgi:hypothetical protein